MEELFGTSFVVMFAICIAIRLMIGDSKAAEKEKKEEEDRKLMREYLKKQNESK